MKKEARHESIPLKPHTGEKISKALKSCKLEPNKKEIVLDSIIQKARPIEFIYSGDGKIVIGGKIPDWFNINGKKQVIELFGDFWHGKERTGRSKEQEERRRITHFKKYGYNCLIVWESEIKNNTQLFEKIRRFL